MRSVPMRVGDRGGGEERDLHRQGAGHQVAADHELRAHRGPRRPQRHAGRAAARAGTAAAAMACASTLAIAEPSTPEVEPVDQERRRDRAGGVGAEQVRERPAHLLHAAHPALAGERDEDERRPERGDAQPVDGGVLRRPSSSPAMRPQAGSASTWKATASTTPSSTASHVACTPTPTASSRRPAPNSRDGTRRRPVGQEVAEPGDVRQQRPADRDAGELLRAEVADDRGVDEHVQRLRGQRAERRHGEAEDRGGRRRGRPSPGAYEPLPGRRRLPRRLPADAQAQPARRRVDHGAAAVGLPAPPAAAARPRARRSSANSSARPARNATRASMRVSTLCREFAWRGRGPALELELDAAGAVRDLQDHPRPAG